MMRPTLFATLLAIVTFFPGMICAEERRFEELNCAVTLPDGAEWIRAKLPDNSNVRAAAQMRDKSASLILSVTALPNPTVKLDSQFIASFDQGSFPAGKAKKTSGTQLMIQGVPAYKTTGELYVNGTTMQTAKILWIADGKVYTVSTMKLNAPPLEDAALRTFMTSFHFLKPPNA